MSTNENSLRIPLNLFPLIWEWVVRGGPIVVDLSSVGFSTIFRSPPTIIEDRYPGSTPSRTVCRNSIWFSFGAYTLIRAIVEPAKEPYTTRNLPSGSAVVLI
ncbi:hypothetical protein FKM82_024981 [Ascaphus truei]